jgi:hypothetical protein
MEENWKYYLKDKRFLSELPVISRKDEILSKQRVFIRFNQFYHEKKKSYPEREDRII